MNELTRLEDLVLKLRKESSSIVKKQILKNYSDLKNLLKVIYDPLYIFHVTSRNFKNYYEETNNKEYFIEGLFENYMDFFCLLKDLNSRKLTGNSALLILKGFYNFYKDFISFDLFCNILDKDLKCGISTKIINSVFKNLIPEFNVPLANVYKEGKCDFKKEKWFASRKLDGVRCLCFIYNKDNIKFFSRNGKQFETLNNLIPWIKDFIGNEKNIILDGEVCIIDEKGNENFKSVISQIRRKNYTIKKPKFFIFGVYPIFGFLKNIPSFYSINHLKLLSNLFVEHINQIKINSKEELTTIINSLPENWEGLILKKFPMLFKRSNNLLKIKKFKEIDLKVVGVENSIKCINGHQNNCIGALKVKYKGNIVKIGSGLTDRERLSWFYDNLKIINKVITVKYFSESKDKNGKLSLRFPIFKGVRNYE